MGKLFVCGVASLVLGGCGGSEGGDSPPPPPLLNSAPGAAAINVFVQASHFTTLHATDPSGNNWSLVIAVTPNGGTTTFNGTANATSSLETDTFFKNGAVASNSVSTGYHLVNPYVPLGRVFTNGVTKIVSNIFPLPTTITVGQSGPLDTVTSYHDAALTTVDATTVETFSVAANDSTTLLLCVEGVTSNVTAQGAADGFVAGTRSSCYTVDAAGNTEMAKVVTIIGGVTLTFQ